MEDEIKAYTAAPFLATFLSKVLADAMQVLF